MRHSVLTRLLARTALALGAAGLAPHSIRATAAPAPDDAAYELRSISVLAGTVHLSVANRITGEAAWIGVGESLGALTLVSFDPARDTAVVRLGGRELTLPLIAGRSIAYAPVEPAAEAPAAGAHNPRVHPVTATVTATQPGLAPTGGPTPPPAPGAALPPRHRSGRRLAATPAPASTADESPSGRTRSATGFVATTTESAVASPDDPARAAAPARSLNPRIAPLATP